MSKFVFKRLFVFTLAILFSWSNTATAEMASYNFDHMHSEITASWNHGGVSQLSAKFPKFKGEFFFDEKDIASTKTSILIDVRSVTTGFQALDSNIASENFFDPVTFPEIGFTSTSVRRTGSKTALMTGDLSLHGITKPIELAVELVHQGEHALKWFHVSYKGEWLGFRATTTINRSDFGLDRWAPFVSDKIDISIAVALKKEKE